MIAFKVTHNGIPICTAGVNDFGVLSTIISWVRREPEPATAPSEPEEELNFHVGVFHSPTRDHRTWDCPQLVVGDTVSIEIAETDQIDSPDGVNLFNQQMDLEQQQLYVKQKAKQWGWTVTESSED